MICFKRITDCSGTKHRGLVKGCYNNPQLFISAGSRESGKKSSMLNILKIKPVNFVGGLYVERERMRKE